VPTKALTRDIKTEVLIVGAGISGAMMAEELSRRHRVVVIDRRGVAKGSTAASTALIEHEIDLPLTRLAERIGTEDAIRAWRRCRLAVDSIAARTAELGIRCNLVTRNSLYLAGDLLGAGELEAESDARRAAGIESVHLTATEVRDRFGIQGRSALLSFNDLAVDPRRMTAGYLLTAMGRGAKIYTPVQAAGVEHSREGIAVATVKGPTIKAEIVIFCTGYELARIVRPRDHQLASTFAFATPRQPKRLWPGRCMIWEAAERYLYIRDAPDGRVLCGGEDEDLVDAEKRDALIASKVRALQRKLHQLMPQLKTTAAFSWAGTFGTTSTGLPVIGPIPRYPNCWTVLGFGGNGITYSRIAADVIAAELQGSRDPDDGIYRKLRR
jgi:glycine/D-amino acid oxidase-like deaminating enzyme